MKKLLFALMLAGLSLAWGDAKARILFTGFYNDTGDTAYDAVATAAGDSLSLTLRQLNAYDIVRQESDTPILVTKPADIVKKNNLDYLLYGSLANGKDSVVVKLTVYNGQKKAQAFSREKELESVLDSFSTIDELTTAALENMTGAHIGYGYVSATIEGKRAYQLKIDDTEFGDITGAAKRTLAGEHSLKIYTMKNNVPAILMERKLTIPEGQTVNLYVIDTDVAPERAETKTDDSDGELLVGIGITINKIANGAFIMSIFPGAPADQAGIQPGEVITKVDDTDVKNLTETEISKLVQGKQGTVVRLTIIPYKGNLLSGHREVSVIRQKIYPITIEVEDFAYGEFPVQAGTISFFIQDSYNEIYGYDFSASSDFVYTRLTFEMNKSDHIRHILIDIKITYDTGETYTDTIMGEIQPEWVSLYVYKGYHYTGTGKVSVELSYKGTVIAKGAYYTH